MSELTSVTVVIPTRGDRPALLARALTSVHRQTRPPDEVLVVVDGAGPVEAPGARLLTGGRSRGVSHARNVGAFAANGTFVAFLDDDDVWKPRYLESALTDDDVDVVLTATEKHRPQGVRLDKVPPVDLRVHHFLVRNPGLQGSNLLIRRSVLIGLGGFDEDLPALEDMDLGVRLSVLPGIRYRRVTDPLVEYHSHHGPRLTTRGTEPIRTGASRFLAKHLSHFTDDEIAAFRTRALELWGWDPVPRAA